jgi:hypothetical protein
LDLQRVFQDIDTYTKERDEYWKKCQEEPDSKELYMEKFLQCEKDIEKLHEIMMDMFAHHVNAIVVNLYNCMMGDYMQKREEAVTGRDWKQAAKWDDDIEELNDRMFMGFDKLHNDIYDIMYKDMKVGEGQDIGVMRLLRSARETYDLMVKAFVEKRKATDSGEATKWDELIKELNTMMNLRLVKLSEDMHELTVASENIMKTKGKDQAKDNGEEHSPSSVWNELFASPVDDPHCAEPVDDPYLASPVEDEVPEDLRLRRLNATIGEEDRIPKHIPTT